MIGVGTGATNTAIPTASKIVTALEFHLRRLSALPTKNAAAKSTVKKATRKRAAKKAAAKRTVKKATRKRAAKKAAAKRPAKRRTAKKTTARKPAKRRVAKRR